MLSRDLARDLHLFGVRWTPSNGDSFVIIREGFEGDLFVVSDMTIETHEFETGTILGFNGTTEWALDSVAIEDALWIPHEHQLRELLGGTFLSLSKESEQFRVESLIAGERVVSTGPTAADAYATALLALVKAAVIN